MPEFFGGGRLVAVVAFQGFVDGLQFQFAQRHGADAAAADVRDRWRPIRRSGRWSTVIGGSSQRMVACSITLASSRTLPGQGRPAGLRSPRA